MMDDCAVQRCGRPSVAGFILEDRSRIYLCWPHWHEFNKGLPPGIGGKERLTDEERASEYARLQAFIATSQG